MSEKGATDSSANGHGASRRRFNQLMVGGASLLAAPAILSRSPRAAERIIVAQPGGPYEVAYQKAFAEPFQEATGVEVVLVARPFFPSGLVQSQVETGSYQWDVVSLSAFDVEILAARDMLEPLDLPEEALRGIMESAKRSVWLGVDVYATVMAYRTDRFEDRVPEAWANLWDDEGLPGRRAMYESPIGTLEEALLADGVTPKQLYPIDYERAFKKLDEVKPKVDIWWSSGAQSTQLLRDGDVDLLAIWNGRAQAAIDDGAPAKIVWNQGLYTVHGFSIAKGVPKKDIGIEFIEFCADAERQAAYTAHMASGPTNLMAYDYIEPELAATLPTAPDNIATLIEQDTAWWTEHKEDAVNRFNEWLLL